MREGAATARACRAGVPATSPPTPAPAKRKRLPRSELLIALASTEPAELDPWPYLWAPPPDGAGPVPMVAAEAFAPPGSEPGMVGPGTVHPGEEFLAPPATAVLRAVIGQAALAGPAPPWWPPPGSVPTLRTPAEFLDAPGGASCGGRLPR